MRIFSRILLRPHISIEIRFGWSGTLRGVNQKGKTNRVILIKLRSMTFEMHLNHLVLLYETQEWCNVSSTNISIDLSINQLAFERYRWFMRLKGSEKWKIKKGYKISSQNRSDSRVEISDNATEYSFSKHYCPVLITLC